MPNFHVAWRALAGAGEAGLVTTPVAAGPLTSLTRLAVVTGVDEAVVVSVTVDPVTRMLAPSADLGALHYFRLADGTVKPLPPTPPPLACAAGDAYVAVTPGAARLAAAEPGGASTAIARFLHLRDYFNADKLAGALLAHLLELGERAAADGAGVLVVEAR